MKQFGYFEISKSDLPYEVYELEKEDMLIIRSVTDLTDDINGLLVELFPLLTEKGVELFSCEESFLCGYEYQNTLVGVIELLRYFRSLKKADNYQRALEAGKVGRPAKTDDVEKAIKLYQSPESVETIFDLFVLFPKAVYLENIHTAYATPPVFLSLRILGVSLFL